MKRFFRSKWVRIPFFTFLVVFALIGFFLTGSYVAIKLRLTDESGIVDFNNRYFNDIKNKYNQSFKRSVSDVKYKNHEALHRILLLNEFYPKNAQQILDVYLKSGNEQEVLRMLDAADMNLQRHKSYAKALKEFHYRQRYAGKRIKQESVYEWMNIAEWQTFKAAVTKDTALIDSVARQTGVESRLIVACLVGEQIRLFNSDREAYKQWIGPLQILSVESQFSFGVTGIKEHTAKRIEYLLKDKDTPFYLGEQYEHLLDFNSVDTTVERIDRLTSFRNHYYSYMYAALFLKQVKMQWQREGFPIDDRPEILATLFNVGFPQSEPKRNPRVGGSSITINGKIYSFGAIAYQFYYSGELYDLFPFEAKKFDWDVAS